MFLSLDADLNYENRKDKDLDTKDHQVEKFRQKSGFVFIIAFTICYFGEQEIKEILEKILTL